MYASFRSSHTFVESSHTFVSSQMADRELRLSNHALHLSFNYFDRFLSRMQCGERSLQLVSTACMWIAAKVDGSTKTASQLEALTGIERRDIIEMERWLVRRRHCNLWSFLDGLSCMKFMCPTQLSALRWQVQPVTTFDMVRLFLPFICCERDYREMLAQFVENITLAQALGAHSHVPSTKSCAVVCNRRCH